MIGAKIQSMDHPTPLVVANRGRNCWLLQFRCIWCGRVHSHDGGNVAKPECQGARVSHFLSPKAPAGCSLKITRIER
jgi:hypothetical protein